MLQATQSCSNLLKAAYSYSQLLTAAHSCSKLLQPAHSCSDPPIAAGANCAEPFEVFTDAPSVNTTGHTPVVVLAILKLPNHGKLKSLIRPTNKIPTIERIVRCTTCLLVLGPRFSRRGLRSECSTGRGECQIQVVLCTLLLLASACSWLSWSGITSAMPNMIRLLWHRYSFEHW